MGNGQKELAFDFQVSDLLGKLIPVIFKFVSPLSSCLSYQMILFCVKISA